MWGSGGVGGWYYVRRATLCMVWVILRYLRQFHSLVCLWERIWSMLLHIQWWKRRTLCSTYVIPNHSTNRQVASNPCKGSSVEIDLRYGTHARHLQYWVVEKSPSPRIQHSSWTGKTYISLTHLTSLSTLGMLWNIYHKNRIIQVYTL